MLFLARLYCSTVSYSKPSYSLYLCYRAANDLNLDEVAKPLPIQYGSDEFWKTRLPEIVSQSYNLEDLFYYLKGQNFGNLLQKEFEGVVPLSEAEKDFLDGWRSDRAIRMAAMGLFCHLGKGDRIPFEKLLEALPKTIKAAPFVIM